MISITAALCLAGLLVVQILFIRRNFEWKREAFRQDVTGALASVVEKLEAKETLKRIWTVSFLRKGENAFALVSDEKSRPSLLSLPGETIPKVQAEGGDVVLTLGVPQRVRVIAVEPAGKADRTVLDEIRQPGSSVIPVTRLAAGSMGPGRTNWARLYLDDVLYDLTLGKEGIESVLAHPSVDQTRIALMDKILEQYLVVDPVPIERRIESADLKAAVDEALRERGIDTPCFYGVIPAGREAVILASDDGAEEGILGSGFRTRLFPHDVTVSAGDLAFYFPDFQGSLLARLGAPAAVGLLCLLAAAGCLIYVLLSVSAQKRYAAALTDFVDNMTHEFKTPISTISLIGETLGQEPVRNDPARQAKYRDMIRSECLRMQDQVRKILETAALEKGDLDLRPERIDAHEAIRRAVQALAVSAEKRGGGIETRLNAEDPHIEADPLHFQNVLHNLIDNAVLYTRRPPEIVVATEERGGKLRITVADNGIGIGPRDRKRIFDKYYRVSTGDVHDVKGFGLGLSYVRLIVQAHGGSAAVRSEEGRGSTFEIEMPRRGTAPRRDKKDSS